MGCDLQARAAVSSLTLFFKGKHHPFIGLLELLQPKPLFSPGTEFFLITRFPLVLFLFSGNFFILWLLEKAPFPPLSELLTF